MLARDQLIQACDAELHAARFKDYTFNGLQVAGRCDQSVVQLAASGYRLESRDESRFHGFHEHTLDYVNGWLAFHKKKTILINDHVPVVIDNYRIWGVEALIALGADRREPFNFPLHRRQYGGKSVGKVEG